LKLPLLFFPKKLKVIFYLKIMVAPALGIEIYIKRQEWKFTIGRKSYG